MFDPTALTLANRQLQKGISPGVQASGPFKNIISQAQGRNIPRVSLFKNKSKAQNVRAATVAATM